MNELKTIFTYILVFKQETKYYFFIDNHWERIDNRFFKLYLMIFWTKDTQTYLMTSLKIGSLTIVLVIVLTISLLFQFIGVLGVTKEKVSLLLTYTVILIIGTIANLFTGVTIFALIINVTSIALSCILMNMLRKNNNVLA
jgi:hypothetical protein